jgi:two-component system, NtrC family, nitrogen regulation sensor histidine kinase NtrY
MAFRRFRINCIIRVLLIGVSIALLIYLLAYTSLIATTFVVTLVIVYQVYALIVFVERTNRDVVRFLEAIEFADFSDQFSTGLRGRSFDELNASFARVSQRFREVRQEREESHHYLQTVVQHIGIGLLAFRDDGKVELVNNAARRMLHTPTINHIDNLVPFSADLVSRLRNAQPGQRQLITIRNGLEPQHLSVLTTQLNLGTRRIILASFQNITSELSAKEMDAWQNLIRVLTHEIRNSLTPISSLAATIEDAFSGEETGKSEVERASRQEIIEALSTIRRRSDGLLGFVDSYRRLTRIPKPSFTTLQIKDIMQDTMKLLQPQLEARDIQVSWQTEPEDLVLVADVQLIGQVLMNLVLNAMEALVGRTGGVVAVRAFQDGSGRVRITVTDNGPGIVPEALDQIFVPFYTTKKGGSGIGLSLSRQIMRLHHGGLTVTSEPDRQTVFSMIF